jgi:hypothetical protein
MPLADVDRASVHRRHLQIEVLAVSRLRDEGYAE